MSNVIACKFKIEDNPPQIHRFEIHSEKKDAQTLELKELIAGEWKCRPVDVTILEFGETEKELATAPPEAKKLPSPAQIKAMKRANLEILAKELEIDADLDEIKVDDLRELVGKRILEIQTDPAG